MNSLPNQKGKDAEISSFARSASSVLKKHGQEDEIDIESTTTKVYSKYISNSILSEIFGIIFSQPLYSSIFFRVTAK